MHHAHIDKFAHQHSLIHRLDSRVKLIVIFTFTILVILVKPYDISSLMWYAVGPVAMLVIGGIPLKFTAKQIAIVSPFILVLAISCIFFDKQAVEFSFGPWKFSIAGGWIRAFSILCKFIITMAGLIALISTTRFQVLLCGMEKLGLPKMLVTQLGFLYRYIFLLIDKAGRMLRARSVRKLAYLGFKTEMKTAGAMVGNLLISSIDMASRTGLAMEARGFDGKVKTLSNMKISRRDWIFISISIIYMIALKTVL